MLLVALYLLNNFKVKFVLGLHHDLETLNFLKRGFSILGIFRSYSFCSDYSSYYFSSVRVKEIENFSNFLSINSYLRNEVPLLNSRVRKSNNFYMLEFKFFGVGVGSNYFTYPVKLISNNTNSLIRVFNGKDFVSRLFLSLKNKLVIFYKFNLPLYLNKIFKVLFNPLLIKIDYSISKLASAHLGVSFLEKCYSTDLIYSVGLNTDFVYSPLLYQGHHGTSNTANSYVIMPTTVFSEKTSNFLNLEGIIQKAHAALSPGLLVKKDEEIFKALSELNSTLILSNSFLTFKNLYPIIKLDTTFFLSLPY